MFKKICKGLLSVKKGAKITFLIMAVIWVAIQCYYTAYAIVGLIEYNSYINNISKFVSLFISIFLNYIPVLLFSVVIFIVFIAELANKVLKHEKIVFIISAVLILSYIVEVIINLLNFSNIFSQSDLQRDPSYYVTIGSGLFNLLVWFSVLTYLLAIIFKGKKLKEILIPIYVVAMIVSTVLSEAVLIFIGDTRLNLSTLFTSASFYLVLLLNIVQFLAVLGFMLIGRKNPNNPVELTPA